MKTVFTLLSIFVIFTLACKKKSSKEIKPPSIITVIANGKSYQLTVIDQFLKISDTAELRMFAASSEYKVDIHAKSISHNNGIGDYFLFCCNNDFWDNSSSSTHYECLRGALVNNIETQMGFLKISSKDGKSLEGSFSMTGQNSEGKVGNISGSIKVFY